MQLYMNKLMGNRPIAVRFGSRAEAELFFSEMKRNYPFYVRNWSCATYQRSDEDRGGVCYCPYFNEHDGSMTHGSKQTYINRCIRVIEFSDLLFDDEEEIAESALSVDFLMN